MKIAIVGPIATEDIACFLNESPHDLPPGYAGAPLLATLIAELLSRGHSVSAFTTTSTGLALSTAKCLVGRGERFKIHYCAARPRAFRPADGYIGRAADLFALERRKITAAIKEDQPDVVHAHWSYEFGLAAIETGLPHVITCHDAPQVVLRYMPTLYRLARYWMARRCLKNAGVVTAVSPYIELKNKSYTINPISVVPNPLPPSVFENPVAQWAEYRESFLNRPLISVVANGWGRLKNIDAALRAFQIFREKAPSAKLCMFGADLGPNEAAERWAAEHSMAKGVAFVGRLPHKILLAELSKSHALLHPSLLEGCPMGVAEAMALGLPVIGGKESGGVPWVVGAGGVLTDVRSPVAIAHALEKLLMDKAFYRKCAHNAVERAKKIFSVKTVADEYERQYIKALGKN